MKSEPSYASLEEAIIDLYRNRTNIVKETKISVSYGGRIQLDIEWVDGTSGWVGEFNGGYEYRKN